MKAKIDNDEGVEVQMAPLIDCVFLLLIFFLVATTLKQIDDEVPILLPDAQNAIEVQQPDDFSAIGIDAEGNFYIDGARTSKGRLLTSMERFAAGEPSDKKIRVDIDREARWQDILFVLNNLRFYDLDYVGANTEPEARPDA